MPYRNLKDAAEYKRKWREQNVFKNLYIRLKSRAKERGHTCGISFEDFKQWCEETNYHLLRGKHAQAASIDRIDSTIGYEKGNLQVLTLSENSIKEQLRRKGIEWQPIVNNEENPF